MDLSVDADMWLLLGLCAALCCAGSVFYTLMVLRKAPSRSWAAPLAVVNGLRNFAVASTMSTIAFAHSIHGPFTVYDEEGGFSFMFELKEAAMLSMSAAVLSIFLELLYVGWARFRGRRGLLITEMRLAVPFAFLFALFLADAGMYMPMV